jgi:2-polyprenyl-3-methyl-5-hydroxy-6-metoxy-1,4-benzoquinol methylase
MDILKLLGQIIRKVYRRIKGKPYILSLKENLTDCRTILDLGCGRSSPIEALSKNVYSVGVEIFKPAILQSKEKRIHNDYILAEMNNLCFRPKSFDAVLALDVLEHLKKAEGLHLIKNMEKIARNKVVIFTPNGFVPQAKYDKNVFQIHLSGWTVNELKRMGYKVNGINGLKILRKEKAELRFRPAILFGRLADISQKLTYYFPHIAFQLLCVKLLRQNDE